MVQQINKRPLPTILLAEWHTKRNLPLSAADMTTGSGRIVWWIGKCNHEYSSSIKNRALRGDGCSICAGKAILVGFNDLQTTHPHLIDNWDYEENKFTPQQITAGSSKSVTWKCKLGHTWPVSPANRLRNESRITGCPTCAGKIVLQGFNDFATIQPQLVQFWDVENNGILKPSQVTEHSNRIVFWKCASGHPWKGTVASLSRGRGCPTCVGKAVLIGANDLQTTHPILSAEWHPTENRNLLPTQFSKGSDQEIIWLGRCGHEWQAQIKNRTNGTKCPICDGKTILVGFNDLASQNSFLTAEWHPTKNKGLLPHQVHMSSGQKVWWQCAKNSAHVWATTIDSRSSRGSGCGDCVSTQYVSKPENELAGFLKQLGYKVEQTNRKILGPKKELDLYLPEQNLGIEFNGVHWHTELTGKMSNYHNDKYIAAQKAGLQLLQIWEDDWVARKSIIFQRLEQRLSPSTASPKIDTVDTAITEINRTEANLFLNADLQRNLFSESVFFLLSYNSGWQSVVEVQAISSDSIHIVNHSHATNDITFGLKLIMVYLKERYKIKTILIRDHNDWSYEKAYQQLGFKEWKQNSPALSYEYRSKRTLSMSFGNKNLPKIWDSGSSDWIKNF